MKPLALLLLLLLGGCAGRHLPPVTAVTHGTFALHSAYDQAYATGKIHLGAGRVGLALVSFQRALAFQPLSVAALNAAGIAYDALHRPELALPLYLRALALEPGSADTLNNLAIATAMLGEPQRAQDLLQAALTADPANVVIIQNARLIVRPASLRLVNASVPAAWRLDRIGEAEFRLQIRGASAAVAKGS